MKNIVLIGFMGAGKSVAAKELAKRLKREFFSTDALLEKKEGRPIAEIFQASGEAYFRKIESAVVKELAAREGIIVDCGGGVFLNPENSAHLKKTGTVFYLFATSEVLHERTKAHGHRPLLKVADPLAKIKELLKSREPFYKQADHQIDTSGKTNAQVCAEILEILKNE
ncbi:MAG: hypothetical protein A2787_02430 [Omnitrophica WOR_2 bacterium RIFCSPHIGHO2_01_FULL_48_9]|nr:MAG: hypothetical protein A3D10_03065 [Omnitrophica WOR_2 bacterium RIFCSPHIGHO2_02_FULL_48_11]OGX33499.1 MAG: hypothetical protein A2787_02430 [Omnitrophica WOR_2 bacterium RIFCSPHIGHO2_01_FULL_48_9]